MWFRFTPSESWQHGPHQNFHFLGKFLASTAQKSPMPHVPPAPNCTVPSSHLLDFIHSSQNQRALQSTGKSLGGERGEEALLWETRSVTNDFPWRHTAQRPCRGLLRSPCGPAWTFCYCQAMEVSLGRLMHGRGRVGDTVPSTSFRMQPAKFSPIWQTFMEMRGVPVQWYWVPMSWARSSQCEWGKARDLFPIKGTDKECHHWASWETLGMLLNLSETQSSHV